MPIKRETDENSLKDSSITNEEDKDYGNLIIDLIIDFPESLSETVIRDLKQIFEYEQNIKKDALIAYYYKDKEEIVKELMNESEEDNEMGCIQQ